MLRQVEQDISRYGIIEQGDRITVGLSGGADSVCLLLLLLELKQKYGLTLKAVHVHHGLRGAEADEDEVFVRDLCERLGVPLAVRHADVKAQAERTGCSVEEAGRKLRYRALREEAEGGKIATAHHSDDNCETILFNILRGTGFAGLAGIPQVNGDVIRPLLHVTREQIEDYLKEKGQPYRTDATNASPAYARNRIRNELLPWLEREINAGAREHLLNLGKRAAEAEALIGGLAKSFYEEQAVISEDAVELPLEALKEQPSLV
ncbi:MAG: tRNA lysidine(34) synthetase TilS [Lachnospiraceae bacterium]|nr:tRNA lysidine(34) synthetase TilS [Lachnospiraceae bacterium]